MLHHVYVYTIENVFFQYLFVLKMNIQFLKNVYTQSNFTLKLITRLISMYCYNDLISINGFIQGPFWDYFVNYCNSADLYMHTFVTVTIELKEKRTGYNIIIRSYINFIVS